nr:MAG TPA: hypothetical protein [Caudoviricetes sp.]
MKKKESALATRLFPMRDNRPNYLLRFCKFFLLIFLNLVLKIHIIFVKPDTNLVRNISNP